MIRRFDILEDARTEVIAPRSASTRPVEEQIANWLDVLAKLLPVPAPERASIRDELEEHLRERVHDLMVGGNDEQEAVRAAIRELGEAAELARRYRDARRHSKRRWMMNLTALALGTCALAAGVFTFLPQNESLNPTTFEPVRAEPPAALTQATLDLRIDTTMEKLVDDLMNVAGLGVSIDWGTMDQMGLERDAELGISGRKLPVSRVLELLAERTDGEFGWRVDGEMIRLGDATQFDRADRVLVVYDVDRVIDAVGEEDGLGYDEIVGQIGDVITSFVEPGMWEEMGGQVGHFQFIGRKLFVEAPPRMHRQVEWILQQLQNGGGKAAAEFERQARDEEGAAH